MANIPSSSAKKTVTDHATIAKKPTSSEKHADAIGARLDDWIVYKHGEDLGSWLDSNKPSKVKRDEHVGWIAIYNKDLDDHASRDGDMDRLLAKWETMRKSADEGGPKINFDLIREMARDCGFVAGKWIFHISTGDQVDGAWRKVCHAMIGNGVLADLVTRAKVSPFDRSVRNYQHVISVHGSDYSNFDEVCRLEKALRAVGITSELKYKPDVYSHLGIYVNNNWGIRPTIYLSQYDCMREKSNVISSYKTCTGPLKPTKKKSAFRY